MRIGLYIEHGVGNGIGGAELMIASLAGAWSHDHEVDLVHHRPSLTRERMSSYSGESYERVRFRYVPREPEPPSFANPLRRYGAAREWHASVSSPYDLFVNCTHWLPCFCHARRGALLVMFPFYVRPRDAPAVRSLRLLKQLRHRAYYDFEWARRLSTYSHRLAISGFARDWARRRWGVDCTVVYPPANVDAAPGPKQPLILSIGRFATLSHGKKQLEMMRAFRELRSTALAGWSYASVGSLNDRAENHAYFERLRDLGRGWHARVEANLAPADLRELLASARIFWHATGYGDDTDAHPELAEHFGIATVEAMAAGCVPVVINKGGQPEIVEHGRSGFVWNTLEELKRYTRTLADDPALWTEMSEAACRRAQPFTRARFIDRMSDACGVTVSRLAAAPRSLEPSTAGDRIGRAGYWTRKSAMTGR
jgi:glycosyltransferase involved in cell wall biosynthesis